MAAEKQKEVLLQEKMAQETKIAEKQQATLWYIIAGNTLVITIAALIFVLMRRKKSK